MKQAEPQGLRGQRWASLVLALLLLGLELAWAAAVAFAAAQLQLGLPGAKGTLALAAVLAVANTWALARVVRNAHFLWLFTRWPLGAAGHPVLDQAVSAFADADLERVLLLAAKDADAPTAQALRKGAGRALALLGRVPEAADALRGLPDEEERLRWLEPRPGFGRERPPYFKRSDAAWSRRQFWLALFALASLATWGAFVEQQERQARAREAALTRSFDGDSFETLVQGSFTVHHHDLKAAQDLADLATRALGVELAFLGRGTESVAPGSFHLYLCDTRDEYLKRTPHAPAWEEASAVPTQNSIYLYKHDPDQRIYFEVVVAHELSHLLYHRFVPVHFNDAWLDEGLADYQGYAFALDRAGFARQAWLSEHVFRSLAKRNLSFSTFFQVDPYQIKDTADVSTFYRQGFSIVFMLIEHYGRKDFLRFLDHYRLAKGDATKALAATYPTIQNTSQLAAVWGLFYGQSN